MVFAECRKWFGAGWNSARGGMKQYELHLFSILTRICCYQNTRISRADTVNLTHIRAHLRASTHTCARRCTRTYSHTSITMQRVCCSGTTSAARAILPSPCFPCFFFPLPYFSAPSHPWFTLPFLVSPFSSFPLSSLLFCRPPPPPSIFSVSLSLSLFIAPL